MRYFEISQYLAFFVVVVRPARPHSWLACTDYVEKNAAQYDVSKCRGYPRAANVYASKTTAFGEDTGYDHKPTEGNPCKQTRNDDQQYDSDHPMAVYYPGQQVVLAHPMKNHGADVNCGNIYIPDSGNFIYRGPRDGGSDPSLSAFRTNEVFDLGVSVFGQTVSALTGIYPKPGFQNAPAFCDDKDKSLGTYSFNVPTDLLPGRYTFLWLWAFNSPGDLYSTCFEVDIVASRQERNEQLQANGFADTSEPCGEVTSNPRITGNCNRDETTTTTTTTVNPTTGNGTQRPCPTCGSEIVRLHALLLTALLMLQFIVG